MYNKSMPTLDELKKVRIEKLEALRKQGIDPYPSQVKRSATIAAARNSEGVIVSITGRVIGLRRHGKLLFFDLLDGSGQMQVMVRTDDIDKKTIRLLDYIDIGDFLSAEGKVGKTTAGEISIFATNLQLLTKSLLPLPDQWYGLKDIEERYRKRYLDMILNSEVRDRLHKRGQIIQSIRDILSQKDYVEVETPTLQPVYGGGFARPFVTHHNELDSDFYLRISDEMYLKRLIVGGFDKVYEITKVFRNEGVDHDHNPEFTMFEAQIAYEDYRYGMDIIEEIIEHTAKKVLGSTDFSYQGVMMSLKRPWTRLKLVDAVKEHTGIDSLSWKSLEEAKADIHKIKIAEGKLESLKTMHTVGEVVAFAFEEAVEEKLIQPTIIYDYPIETSPLAKKCEDPRFTQRFEMFANGSELGNNYTELNDPIDLHQRFVEEKRREAAGFDEAHQTDYDYLTAIEHGFPPTCGIAIGIDRLVMLLTDAKSIKEVIAFPTLRPLDDKPVSQVKESSASVPKSKRTKKTVKTDGKEEMSSLTRDEAITLLHSHMQNTNLRRHCYAVGFAMRALAEKLGGDADTWEVLGILHDADWEETKDDLTMHTKKTLEYLKEKGITDGPIVHALMSHNRKHTELAELDGLMEWALETVDELTGFIVAVALVRPDKKLATVGVDSVMKKWKAPEFARAVDRTQIAQCGEKLGIPLNDFVALTLSSMQEHASALGL